MAEFDRVGKGFRGTLVGMIDHQRTRLRTVKMDSLTKQYTQGWIACLETVIIAYDSHTQQQEASND